MKTKTIIDKTIVDIVDKSIFDEEKKRFVINYLGQFILTPAISICGHYALYSELGNNQTADKLIGSMMLGLLLTAMEAMVCFLFIMCIFSREVRSSIGHSSYSIEWKTLQQFLVQHGFAFFVALGFTSGVATLQDKTSVLGYLAGSLLFIGAVDACFFMKWSTALFLKMCTADDVQQSIVTVIPAHAPLPELTIWRAPSISRQNSKGSEWSVNTLPHVVAPDESATTVLPF